MPATRTATRYDWLVPVACLLAYAALEVTWFWIMAPAFYLPQFARIQPGVSVPTDARAAALCYAVLLPAVYFFLLHPIACARVPVWPSVARAAAMGLVVYGVYNLTNRATLAHYSWLLALVDTAWGVSALVAVTLVAQCVAARRRGE